jgi:hypothetical protein
MTRFICTDTGRLERCCEPVALFCYGAYRHRGETCYRKVHFRPRKREIYCTVHGRQPWPPEYRGSCRSTELELESESRAEASTSTSTTLRSLCVSVGGQELGRAPVEGHVVCLLELGGLMFGRLELHVPACGPATVKLTHFSGAVPL